MRGESSIGAPTKVEHSAAQHREERTLAGRLHYFWSLTAAALLLLIFGTPVVPISWAFNRRHWVYPWALFGARAWLRLSGMEVVVRGRENLDPEKTYVLAANHRSYLDTATIFGHAGRRIGFLAKKELLKIPILGHGMGFVNIMAIDRSNRTRALETVRAATDRIRSGRTFGVFVEGRRAPRGELLPFKKGAFYMARDAGVDVVPVAIKNTDMLMGKGTGVSRPGRIEMVLLPPVSAAGVTSDDDISRVIATVREAIKRELEQ
jgi:1-acyl-sn-glycerol-3-phosphate acyltransferase